jgi:hypothetical protein
MNKSNRTGRWMVVAIVMVSLTLAFAGVASAEGNAQQTTNETLETMLRRENNVLGAQANRLRTANNIATRVQAWIDRLNADGKDTGLLETALSTFKTNLASAQASHDEAAAILAAHNGFDANGKVTDRQAAIETVRSVGSALKTVHRTLSQAVIELRKAIIDWRAANH